ncbi:type 1 glutamine amidotransferase [Roseovarius sp. EL26]|uniref:type 1 glutamine amidotransferase n=1 Tax=Roseovarius sp. EL26 TaxID=2126672 RepID=UPI000EA3B73C|nr:type 1 glutamine amidotransferase [Roseovarius sp. EL26]
MKLLVFQHLSCEHPGSLRDLLKRNGIEWDVVELDEGGAIPDLEDYDVLWVMGGPMDVWDVEEHPWLIAEKAAIRRWVIEMGKPYLGLCLGHQLLADALGGTCGPMHPAEIGVMEVELTAEGRADPLMQGLPDRQKCLQWHGVRVAQPPEGAVILASSPACSVQAMRIGQNVWSTQYHIEVEPDTVDNWAAIPAYHAALVETLGAGGLDAMRAQAIKTMPDFLTTAEQVFENFMAEVKRQA